MSDTPRTDAYLQAETGVLFNSRAAQFMRELERENEQLKQTLAAADRTELGAMARSGEMRAKLEEARRENESLRTALQAASKLLAKTNREQSYSVKELDEARQLVHRALYGRSDG